MFHIAKTGPLRCCLYTAWIASDPQLELAECRAQRAHACPPTRRIRVALVTNAFPGIVLSSLGIKIHQERSRITLSIVRLGDGFLWVFPWRGHSALLKPAGELGRILDTNGCHSPSPTRTGLQSAVTDDTQVVGMQVHLLRRHARLKNGPP